VKAKFIGAIIVALIATVGLVGCMGPSGSTGSIDITFHSVGAKGFAPPAVQTDLVDYIISGSGPNGATFTSDPVLKDAGIVTVSDLLPGDWTILVVGRNAAGEAIGEGAAGPVTVQIGLTAHVGTVDVIEYVRVPGTGEGGIYDLTVNWEPAIVLDPVFVGTLQGFTGGPISQTFPTLPHNPTSCTTAVVTNDLDAGFYTNVVRLYDQPGDVSTRVLSSGFATVVRIAARRTTTGTVDLHAVQGQGGIDILINPVFYDPLPITGSPVFATGPTDLALVYGGQHNYFTVTAMEAASFVWYLRGGEITDGVTFTSTSSTIDLNTSSMIPDETYRLDVIAFNANGTKAASGTYNVVLQTYTPDQLDSEGTVTASTFLGPSLTWSVQFVNPTTLEIVAGGQAPYVDGAPTRSFSIPNVPVGTWAVRVQAGPPYSMAHGFYLGGGDDAATSTLVTFPNAVPGPVIINMAGSFE
jgi:hypothetical protein